MVSGCKTTGGRCLLNIHVSYKTEIQLVLVEEIKDIDKTFSWRIFNFLICYIVLMNLCETGHLKRCDMVTVGQAVLLSRYVNCDGTQHH